MQAKKRVYRAPSLEACGSLRTITSRAGTNPDPVGFDSPVTGDVSGQA